MNMADPANPKELDSDWIELMKAARSLGFGIEEIRVFLKEYSPPTDREE